MIIRRLEEIRKEKGITQKDLACKIGKSREWYSQVLQRGNLTVNDLMALCEFLEVSSSFLLEGERKEVSRKEKESFINTIKTQEQLINVQQMLINKLTEEINEHKKTQK